MEKDNEYTYEAFISYRHCSFDRRIALLIHRKLETFRIPRSFSRPGESRMLKKIFLDNKELPTSSDLSRSIYDALLESRHLIVVCSKNTIHSDYVKQEVETFVKLGRQNRIIPVLINGDQEVSFPLALRKLYETDSIMHLIDVRTISVGNTKKLLKQKIYEMISILSGLSYPDLAEVEIRRRNFRMFLTSFSVASILMIFGGAALYSSYRMYDLSLRLKYQTGLITDSIQSFLVNSLPVFHMDENAARIGIDALKRNEESITGLLGDDAVITTADAFMEDSDYSTSEELEMTENLAENLLLQGDLYFSLNEYDNSSQAYEEALKTWLSAKEAYTKSSYLMNKHDALMLRLYEKLGNSSMNLGNYSQAFIYYQSGIDIGSRWSERIKEEGGTYDLVLNSCLGRILFHTGELYYHSNEMSLSQQMMNQAAFYLTSLRKNLLTDIDEIHIKWLYELAENCSVLRELYSIFGDQASVKGVIEDEIKIRLIIQGKDPSIGNRYELAQCYSLSAGFLMQENQTAEADSMARQEYELRLELNREAADSAGGLISRQQHAVNLLRLGNYYQREGKITEAESAYQEGISLLKNCVDKNTHLLLKNRIASEVLWHSGNYFSLLLTGENYDDVSVHCRNDREWISALFSGNSTENNSFIREMVDQSTGNLYYYEALAMMKKDNIHDALELVQKGIALLKPHYMNNNQNIGLSLSFLYELKANILLTMQQFAEAQENADEATLINPSNIKFQITLAHTYLFNGQTDKAKKIYLQYRDTVPAGSEKTFGGFIKDDFLFFRKQGLPHEAMDEIEDLIH